MYVCMYEKIDVDTHAPCWPRPYQNLRTRDVRINRSDKAFLSVTKQRTCKKEKVQDKGTAIELNKGKLFLGYQNVISQVFNFILYNVCSNFLLLATAKLFMEVIQRACASIIDARAHLNDLDTGCGDGDTGDSLSCGAEG